jgi:hypothetical protein
MNRLLKLYTIFLFGNFLKYVSSQTIYNCLSNATCGCSANSAILTKIVGGESAASQTWGWATSLRYTSTGFHFCGGSIIADSYILTAAHCTIGLSDPSLVQVYVGSIYLSVTVQVRDVSYIYINPNYSSVTYVNDISILKLSSPLNLNQVGVNIICLPNVSTAILDSEEYPPPGTNVIAKIFFKKIKFYFLFFVACCDWLGLFNRRKWCSISHTSTSNYPSNCSK